ncbi:MAG: hypothetical protein DI623_11395 [Sphingomonas sanxanigenens]|uniref:Phage tail assembly chaperone-like domain-containing protein n=1 Tax=Sphingomonas sanxanigenens TaxID=397260 RepID=A0A2W5A6Q3_9SPHN|nr:MAG: hypothetical protein DI623_11395 [Sphingomonas sanxanigenens]
MWSPTCMAMSCSRRFIGYELDGRAIVDVPAEMVAAIEGGWPLVSTGGVPSLSDTPHLNNLRQRQVQLLSATDETQQPDRPEEFRTAWAIYRQELRDWPQTETDPANPTEPTPPDADALDRMLFNLTLATGQMQL